MREITVTMVFDLGDGDIEQTLGADLDSEPTQCDGCGELIGYEFKNLSDRSAPTTSLCLQCLAGAEDVTKIVIQ